MIAQKKLIVLNSSKSNKGQKILLIESTCNGFINSRLEFGVLLINKGFTVFTLIPNNGSSEEYKKIESSGIQLLTFPYNRNKPNVFSTLKSIVLFKKIFKQHQFDLIHSFKFQPNFYTCLALLFTKKTKLVLHITGLGVVFSGINTLKFTILRLIQQLIFCFNFLIADQIIFQNQEDQSTLWFPSFFRKKYKVIESSGVDTHHFDKSKYDVSTIRKSLGISSNQTVISFVSRLIWQKGVVELVQAIDAISKKHPNIHALIIGDIDTGNPQSVSKTFIARYANHQNITFLGRRTDIAQLLAASDLYVYPSYYREGVPRSVLEAMSTGLPIITTTMPGCNICVEEGKNGYLIPPKSISEVVSALDKIIIKNNFIKYGKTSRILALVKFQNKIIYRQILEVYTKFLSITNPLKTKRRQSLSRLKIDVGAVSNLP